MKKNIYLLLFISAYSFGQSKEYVINVDDKKEISTFYKFDDDSFIVCSSKDSNSSKKNEPNLIRLNSNLEEIYNITFNGFDVFFDYTNDGAMLNNYHFIPRTTSQINGYHFINKSGKISEVEKDIISGGSELEQSEKHILTADKRKLSDNVQFVINNVQYSLGRKSGRENKKDEYNADDIYLYKLYLETSKYELSNAPSQEIADNLSFRKAHISFLKNDDSSFSLLFEDNTERLYSDISVLTFDLDGKQTNKVKIVTDLEAESQFGNTKTIFDKLENTYYTYGLYHEHNDPNRKWATTKFKGYYIQKFDSQGKLLWKIQKPFLTDSFKDNQSQQDCIYDLNIIGNNKLLFSAGNTDEDILDELIIDKQTGEIDKMQPVEHERSKNGYVIQQLITEQLSIPDIYGENNFFNTIGLHFLSMNDDFSNYIIQYKESKNKLHFKATTIDGGFVVLQSDLKSNEHKLLKFSW